MSQADNLLNALIAGDSETEEHIVVGNDRYITVPENLKRIAVQFDHDVETVTFDCPRYWDNHDLSTMRIYINYMRPDAVPGCFLCENVIVDDMDSNLMHFDWRISKNATKVQGDLSFLVCAKQVDDEGNEVRHWNSELCTDMTVSTGLEVAESIIEAYPDVITYLLERMDAIEGLETVITGTQILAMQQQIDEMDNKVSTLQSTVEQKMEELETSNTQLSNTVTTLSSDLATVKATQKSEHQELKDADALLDARIDSLETILTGAETAIAHSLTGKGVDVPDDMSIQDVAGLIDTIEMDIPTALQGITITTPPTQTEYYQGESFNKAGMIVTADFGDGVTVPVSNYTVSPTVMTEGVTEVTISLTVNGVTKTATQAVTVTSVLANTIPIGSLMSIAESDTSNANYRLVDTDYLGNLLLVREECLDETIAYLTTAASQAYLTKYESSNLDTYLNDTFYGSLPTVTAEAIQVVDIPVRSDASASATQVYLTRNVFALSSTEWGTSGSNLEGETIEYTDNRATSAAYWTRELTGGMASIAYHIKTDGTRANASCTGTLAVRPAFCISKNQPVKETASGWTIAGAPSESPAAYMTVDAEGNATMVGVSFSVDSEGNATITV